VEHVASSIDRQPDANLVVRRLHLDELDDVARHDLLVDRVLDGVA